MYIDVVPNRSSRPAILLREGWREGKRVRKRTLANLTNWPPAKIETLRRALKNETLVSPEDAFHIVRSRPHGHVAAVLGSLRQLGLDRLLAARPSRRRELAVAMIVARMVAPRSQLATARRSVRRGVEPQRWAKRSLWNKRMRTRSTARWTGC